MRKKKDNEKINTIFLFIISFAITGIAVLYGFSENNGRAIAANTIAEKRYVAPREVINEIATDRQRQEAYRSVLPSYKRDLTIEEGAYNSFSDLFTKLVNFKKATAIAERPQQEGSEEPAPTPVPDFSAIQKQLSVQLSDKQLDYILSLSPKELEEFRETLLDLLIKVFDGGVKEKSEEQSLAFVNGELGRLYVEPERVTLGNNYFEGSNSTQLCHRRSSN